MVTILYAVGADRFWLICTMTAHAVHQHTMISNHAKGMLAAGMCPPKQHNSRAPKDSQLNRSGQNSITSSKLQTSSQSTSVEHLLTTQTGHIMNSFDISIQHCPCTHTCQRNIKNRSRRCKRANAGTVLLQTKPST